MTPKTGRWAALKAQLRPALARIRQKVPRGLRFVVGILLIIGGIFGFLPVVGFWMIPLGIMVAAMDVQLFVRWLRKRRQGPRR
ncbi:hypothetical protein SL1157_3234 [Ruegeria lacuscaerulensis ITI-1157]|nr:hypothetical protein SL1157_3234 [Ruegeria lacuscaerulensis ITI-1157]SHI57257.1 hypothetical protein SAMN05444404_0550 [Ruegeria lacuscaerulensis ITI-1157]